MKFYTIYRALPQAWPSIKRTLLVMKITTLLMLVTLLQVSAKGYSQITLKEKSSSLEKVIRSITKQTGYVFVYNENEIKPDPITVKLNNVTLVDALEACFKDQPITYSIVDKNVILHPKQQTLFEKIKNVLTSVDISGKVVNENDLPLPGATVKVKNTGETVITDAKGTFSFRNLDNSSVLVITYIGYLAQEVNVSQGMTVKMKLASKGLSEVIVNKGYYSETQELSTGNAVTVTAKDIEKQPVINPLLAIQGRVAGLQITQNSGVTNGSLNILIRGRTSINSAVGNDPLIVIDGVPYQSNLLADVLGNNGGNSSVPNSPQGNPLNYVDPNNIASITVLKDADATAIYGSRGGNGVILITTKKGQAGQMTLGLNVTEGVIAHPRDVKLMNTQQYLDMRREAFRNDGLAVPDIATTPSDPNYDINGTWSQTRYTDWQKELLGNFATYTNLNLSLSGGTDLVQYSIRGTYNRQGNLYAGNFDDKRGGLSFNVTAYNKNKRFKVDFIGNILRDDNRNAQSDVTSYTLRAPNAPESFKADGTINFGTSPLYDNSNNPYAYLLRTYSNKTDNITLSIRPTFNIAKGLTATANLGYTDLVNDIKIKQPMGSYSPLYIAAVSPAGINALLVTRNTQRTWIAEPQLNYVFKINDFKFNALAGTSFQTSNNNGQTYVGSSFISDVVIGNIANAGLVSALDNGSSQYNYNAVYGRFNANFKDKYLLNLTGRRDGSSKFGPGNQFGDFYSVAGAWIFTKETGIQNTLSFLSFGKLRASYGTSGNDNISNYAYYDLYQSRGANLYQGMTGFAPTSLANPNVGWEKNAKLEFGMDLGFFRDRIFATAAYYRNRSSNQLLNYTIPSFTGFFSVPNYNFPALVQNSGLEFTLNTRNFDSKSFFWSSSFNISINRNKLLKFDGIENTSYSQIFAIGQPIVGRSVAWIYKGVDPQTGLYTALKNDGTVGSDAGSYVRTDGAYQTTVVNTAPKFFGGFNNTFRYKNLQLDVFLQFVKQTGRLDLTSVNPGYFATSLSAQLGTPQSNVPVEFLDRWQKSGDQAKYQRFTQSELGIQAYGTWAQSDASYVDASYIRAKNVMLSYQLPEGLRNKMNLKNASINLSAQNLFTITPYKGRDPETQSISIMPPQKVIVLGVQINL
jgi:TonB-linked SusC/RagA family outer membrane protein